MHMKVMLPYVSWLVKSDAMQIEIFPCLLGSISRDDALTAPLLEVPGS